MPSIEVQLNEWMDLCIQCVEPRWIVEYCRSQSGAIDVYEGAVLNHPASLAEGRYDPIPQLGMSAVARFGNLIRVERWDAEGLKDFCHG